MLLWWKKTGGCSSSERHYESFIDHSGVCQQSIKPNSLAFRFSHTRAPVPLHSL